MNRFNSLTKPLMWFMALLMVAFVAGCGGNTSSVDLPSVVSVSITPATPSIPISGIQQFTATATYSDGLTHDVTTAPGIAWSSASPLVATISNTAPTIGLATGVANGTSVITATIGGKSATKNLTVTTATLVSIAVTPAAPSIPITTTQQFTAIASYTAGPVINVTAAPGMVWGSSAAGVATISATGMATGVANGSAGITATYGGKTGTANLTVNPAILQSIAVTPATASVPAGLNRQFTATGTYDYGLPVDVTTAASWTSGTAGATVGLHTGLAHGVTANVTPVVITASFGGKNATAALTVTAATVSSIAVTPATPSIAVSGTQPFTATATYSDTTTANVTAASGMVWTSSDPTKATIVSSTGVATGVAAGTTNITAAFGGQTSLADTLTVTAAAGPVVCSGEPNCVNLGTAANFAILTNTGIADAVGSAVITGNIGVSSVTTGASITVTCPELVVGAGIGQMFTRDATPVNTCLSTDKTAGNIAAGDMGTAYTAANAVGGGAGVGTACPGTGNFGGQAIAPGVYTCAGVTIPTNFTLAGTGAATDVWVFKLSGTLGMTGGAGMTFTGTQGALPQNVFWAVAGTVSIGAGSTLEGVVLGASSIATLAGSTVHGRLLSQSAVSLNGGTNVVTQP